MDMCIDCLFDLYDDDDDEDEEWDLTVFLTVMLSENERITRRFAVHPINTKRPTLGLYVTLFKELKDFEDKFFSFFRLTRAQFVTTLRLVEPHIKKETTNFKKPISPEERLCVCLR